MPNPSTAHNENSRLEFVDFAKGFAIASIVVFHLCYPHLEGNLKKIIQLGGSGVHLFFLVSGFGLTLSRSRIRAVDFYRRRLVSVLVPYYLVVLFSYAINHIYPYFGEAGIYALGGHIFLYKMFDERIMESLGSHFWFISTIIQFYLSYPLLKKGLERLGKRLFFGLCLITSCLYWGFVVASNLETLRIVSSFFLQYLWEFALGMVLAELYAERRYQFWQQPMSALAGAAVLGVGLMALLVVKGGAIGRVVNDVPAAIGYISACAFFYQACKKWAVPAVDLLRTVGVHSYALYLIHMLVYLVLIHLVDALALPGWKLAWSMLVILPLVLLLAPMYSRLCANLPGGRASRMP